MAVLIRSSRGGRHRLAGAGCVPSLNRDGPRWSVIAVSGRGGSGQLPPRPPPNDMEQMMAIPASVDGGDRSDAVGLPEQPHPLQSHVIGHGGRKAGLSETSNDYPRVVAILSDGKTRVIVCYAGIQWIVQRRQGEQ
jgi:hypothetical protein